MGCEEFQDRGVLNSLPRTEQTYANPVRTQNGQESRETWSNKKVSFTYLRVLQHPRGNSTELRASKGAADIYGGQMEGPAGTLVSLEYQ